MTSDIPEPLLELARAQAGVVSRRQALAAGVSRAALGWQLQRARWQPLQRGVYAVFTGPPGREATLWAAVLRAGPGAMLSHQTAAELAGLSDQPGGPVHLTVPASRRVRPGPGLVIHISAAAAEARHPAQRPPRTRPALTDAASAARTRQRSPRIAPGGRHDRCGASSVESR